MTKQEYERRLHLKEWKEFTSECKTKMDHQCQMCGQRHFDHCQLHVHHMSYSVVNAHNEYKVLILLCEDCHARLHKYSKVQMKSRDREYLQLNLAKILMRSGKNISFFFENEKAIGPKWNLISSKIDSPEGRIKKKQLASPEWTPDKIVYDYKFIKRLLDGEDISKQEIMETLKIPKNVNKKWRKKLFKYLRELHSGQCKTP
jgi:hypothetical protein